MTDLYGKLGVPHQATPEEIKEAFRNLARDAHPDKGGEPDDFKALVLARDVLLDPLRRKRYDDSGSTAKPKNAAEQHATRCFIESFSENAGDLEHTNIAEDAIHIAKGYLQKSLDSVRDKEAIIDRMKVFIERLSGPDIMAHVIEHEIEGLERSIMMHNAKADEWRAALSLLEQYSYRVDELGSIFAAGSPYEIFDGRPTT